MESRLITLSTPLLTLTLQVTGTRLQVLRCGTDDCAWLHPHIVPGLFAVYANDQRFDALTMAAENITEISPALGIHESVIRFNAGGLQVDYHIRVYDDTALIEMWPQLYNRGDESLHITRLDACVWTVPAGPYDLLHYGSDWGQEFALVREPLREARQLETRFGRSSKGQHPWFALVNNAGGVLAGAVAWSGNWTLRFDPLESGGVEISGGLSDWEFSTDLLPGMALDSPPVILALGPDLDTASQQVARVGRRYWYPRNSLSAALPVEWNHWWSYEDAAISDMVFRANVDEAARLGIDLCVLDAGWFGPAEAGAAWHDYRGDWGTINTERFPDGVRVLADYTHAKGLKFGLWCEIEGIGQAAALAAAQPKRVATRDGERLGYACFGNPDTQEWAYETLCRLIADNTCDWVKLDFNVDPGPGCNRTDHGHGTGDGLLAHYQGYYQVLDRVRRRFPEVVLENCSSGGLRIDLGMLRHTHLTFLSDPDWPVHGLQVFWGASTMLAPDVCLHWSFSEWCAQDRPWQQTFNPRDPALKEHQLDYYTRIAMLGFCGFSQRLPDLPAWVKERLAYHIRIYKDVLRRFVREAEVCRLTDQPKRDGSGDRWVAFQYSLPDESEYLLAVFRLPGAESTRRIQLVGLWPDREYQLVDCDGTWLSRASGVDLMESGLFFDSLPEEGSKLVRIIRKNHSEIRRDSGL